MAGSADPAAGEPSDGFLPASLEDRLVLGARVGMEWGVDLSDGRSEKLQLQVLPEAELRVSRDLRLTARGRLRADVFDRLEPGVPSNDTRSAASSLYGLGDHATFELRELFAEAELGDLLLLVGKQQVVWGTADVLKVLDVVDPQSFREFILEPFDESRIPLWSLVAELPVGPLNTQLVWIPDTTYHDLPEPDALYAFSSPRLAPPPPPGLDVFVQPVAKPGRFPADSDVGFRTSTFWKGWDLSLDYLYHYNDAPVPFSRLSTGDGSTAPFVIVSPRYERTHLVGASFANAFGDLTLRGEVGYSTRSFFPTLDPADSDGVIASGELSYVIGLDWYGLEDAFVSAQLFQSWVHRSLKGAARDPLDSNLSLYVERRFLNDTLAAELTWVTNANDGDGLIEPRIRYEVRDSLGVWAGFHVFYGSRAGLFGQFHDRTRFFVGAEWRL